MLKEKGIYIFVVNDKTIITEVTEIINDKLVKVKIPIVIAITPAGIGAMPHPILITTDNIETEITFNLNIIEMYRKATLKEIELYNDTVSKLRAKNSGLEIAKDIDENKLSSNKILKFNKYS